ncbi:phosphatase domain-containing protein [Bdellovibrio sp. BCCA]|uniref:phosphatase domain-containing protein n=1 Tax=Bdellovibrio sp. BCCA TaxID=3136281 RepID=UPI0030F16835
MELQKAQVLMPYFWNRGKKISMRTISKILLIILIGPSMLYANEKALIISGFDDVLRQAENTGLVKSAVKILEKDKTFAGMPELYSVISKQETAPHFYVVSAISSWFEKRISDFLRASGYPENHRYLRNWLTEWSIEDFKISRIEKIVEDHPQRKFIVIFDNSEPSVQMATALHEKFGDKIQAIYLREVVKKETPSSAISFFTAFDIAMNEFASGRMTTEEVQAVGQAILKEPHAEQIIPSYALCPSEMRCNGVSAELASLCQDVQKHLQSVCAQH